MYDKVQRKWNDASSSYNVVKERHAVGFMVLARRTLGVVLILLVALPVYRVFITPEAGFVGKNTIWMSDTTYSLLWSGFLLVLIPAIVLARMVTPGSIEKRLAGVGKQLSRAHPVGFALTLAVVSGVVTLWFAIDILEGKPNLIDAMAQLLQARYLAAGKLAGPALAEGAFWHIQNTLVTPNGWVSQYPPGHVLLLAVGFQLGAVWLIGPLLVAITVFFTTLVAEKLLPDDLMVARIGAILVAASPFIFGLAAAYMNHITAAAFGTMAIYFALRARDGRNEWAILAGAALAYVFATRPMSAIVFGAVVGFGVWMQSGSRAGTTGRDWLARFGLACLGASPLIALHAVYNAHFFGGIFRFGYDLAHGETTRLGFHQDPWGNWYGLTEAIGYTSADLVALNVNLLESLIPSVALVGAFLVAARRLSAGQRIVVAWALLPVLANLFYWHHGIFMGPRMLNEVAPGWGILTAVAAAGLYRRTPETLMIGRKYSARTLIISHLLIGGIIGFIVLAPQRLLGYRHFMESSRVEAPVTPEPTLVFVHGGWTGRPAMMLAAAGMRLDSVETALRQNSTCRVHRFAIAYSSRRGGDVDSTLPVLDFNPRWTGFPPSLEVSPGNRFRIDESEEMEDFCVREIYAGRNGIIDVSPLMWQGDLPGLPPSGALYVRDMGPELNSIILRRYPERTPLVYHLPAPDADPALVPYEEGMAAIWGRDQPSDGEGR